MTTAAPPHPDVVVVGGGISGLVTAFRLRAAGVRVTLLESSPRVGGAIASHAEAGFRFELGPNTVLENHPSVTALIRDAGLLERQVVAAPAAKRRYVWKRAALLPLPSGPLGFLRTPLFSGRAKVRLLREPFVRPLAPSVEESVAAFVRRRLGQELLDHAVGPFVSGVYAGDPERLSMRWAVAKLWALEQAHGSLIRGAFARRKGPAPGGRMFTFDEGLEALPRRLAERILDVRLHTPVLAVRRTGQGFAIEADGVRLMARQLILAVPSEQLARLLAPLHAQAHTLAELPYAPVAVVALGFRRGDVAHALDGFGFLAPRREDLRILGCLFPSTLFAGRAPEGHVALAAFAGGRTDPAIVDLGDEALLQAVLADLDRALGLGGKPVVAVVRRWPRAIPQYELGHERFVRIVAAVEAAHPGLYVGGNVLGGVSVADCIRNATALCDRVLAGAPPA